MADDLLTALDARVRAIVGEMIDARLSEVRDWVDQDHSPIAKKAHLALARSGKVKAVKHGKRVLIWRADLNAYLARFPVKPREAHAVTSDTDDEIGRLLAESGFSK